MGGGGDNENDNNNNNNNNNNTSNSVLYFNVLNQQPNCQLQIQYRRHVTKPL
jgi:hypothetical protein